MPPNTDQQDQPINLAALRELLLAAFTAEDLRRFCHDHPTFHPIVNRFVPSYGLDDMVEEVITYCEKYLLFDELLSEIKAYNPRQYTRFEHRLYRTPPSTPIVPTPLHPGADVLRASKFDQLNAGVYNNLGLAHYDLGHLDEALADYDRALALDPKYAAAYCNRGNAHYAQGDLAAALTDYDQAIALKPRYAAAYLYRGTARQTQGDLAAALTDYD